MIEVESYLRSRDGQLTPIAEAATPPPDPRHVEGALRLLVDGAPVIDTSQWDDIDQLWAYICSMVAALSQQDEAHTYFPDQPIRLEFRRVGGGRVLVSCGSRGNVRKANASESELIAELQAQGASFFARMSQLLPAERTVHENAVSELMSYRR